jgi:Uncharacterized protein conserved in bacteria (DUF2255)
VNDQIDAAYREKYRRYPDSIINSVLTPAARSSTIELVPPATPMVAACHQTSLRLF